jgi:hypothetical protein
MRRLLSAARDPSLRIGQMFYFFTLRVSAR